MSAPRFGSTCSGIEAASVAFKPLGWQAAWFSEIDTFANKVLAHYPAVPNHGDMTTLPTRMLAGEVEAPDVLCGGTPCQAFSVAGLRKSLDDERGNLTLTFCEIANAIDTKRAEAGKPAAVILWENVPGILSTGDNAFGCFLGALAGEGVALEPAGGKWSNSGCVYGPQRAIAWRVLDAQYFGVPQRRKRLFVVACPLARAHPTQILFECESGGGDFETGRAPKEDDTGLAEAGAGADGVEQPYKVANCLTRRMHKGLNTNLTEGQTPVLAFRIAGDGAVYQTEEQTAPLMTGTDRSANVVLAFHENQRAELTLSATMGSLKCGGGKPGQGYPAIPDGPVVRALMPVECERLQGFPDNYTDIPGASDTARYRALGNSWPVPVVAWIGKRIDAALKDVGRGHA